MIEVRCRAKNEKGLQPIVFQNLFKVECMKEGTIVELRFINDFALAVVMK